MLSSRSGSRRVSHSQHPSRQSTDLRAHITLADAARLTWLLLLARPAPASPSPPRPRRRVLSFRPSLSVLVTMDTLIASSLGIPPRHLVPLAIFGSYFAVIGLLLAVVGRAIVISATQPQRPSAVHPAQSAHKRATWAAVFGLAAISSLAHTWYREFGLAPLEDRRIDGRSTYDSLRSPLCRHDPLHALVPFRRALQAAVSLPTPPSTVGDHLARPDRKSVV